MTRKDEEAISYVGRTTDEHSHPLSQSPFGVLTCANPLLLERHFSFSLVLNIPQKDREIRAKLGVLAVRCRLAVLIEY